MIFEDEPVIKALYLIHCYENKAPETYTVFRLRYLLKELLNFTLTMLAIALLVFLLKLYFDSVFNVKSKGYYEKLVQRGEACEVLNGGSLFQVKQLWDCDDAYRVQAESDTDGSKFKVLRKLKPAN